MDPHQVISEMIFNLTGKIILVIVGLGIFQLFISWLKSPRQKGKRGEKWMNLAAAIHLDKKVYHRINDVTLPSGNGTTQIDHIYVSVYGVFVVETKNISGWIFGDERSAKWTQSIYGKKKSFQNPLRQNYKHVKTLQELLGLADDQIHSVVVFTAVDNCSFKTPMPDNVILGPGKCAGYILSKTTRVLDESDVKEIVAEIESGRFERSRETEQQHIRNLHTKPVRMSEDPLCPKCGSTMVLRTAKRGSNAGNQFWGCSNYPRCKGILNVEH